MNKEKPVNVRILKRILESRKADWGKKLLALISLAHIASEESIGILRSYYCNPDPQMRVYAKMAFEEAKYLAGAVGSGQAFIFSLKSNRFMTRPERSLG